jgi:hypothetical protein
LRRHHRFNADRLHGLQPLRGRARGDAKPGRNRRYSRLLAHAARSPVVFLGLLDWSFQVNETGFVAGDGIRLSEVRPDDRIEVTKSDRIVQFIRFSEQNVFELIQRKLS